MTVPAGKGSDLRDRLTFPSFSDSPGEYDLDLRYLPMLRTPRYPTRHWCFLGEIVDVVTFGRLVIHVRDVTGRELQVAMYDDNRGQKFMSTSIRGHTVAILYAKRHDFLDGGSCFKVDEEYRMTVRPPRKCVKNYLTKILCRYCRSQCRSCYSPTRRYSRRPIGNVALNPAVKTVATTSAVLVRLSFIAQWSVIFPVSCLSLF